MYTISGNTLQNKTYTNKELKKIRDDINNLSKEGHIEIFKIIHQNQEKYSENNNGILFDITKLDNITLQIIEKFINYNNENKKKLVQEENNRELLKVDIE